MHSTYIAAFHQHISSPPVDRIALLYPGFRQVQRLDSSVLDGTEHPAVDIALQAPNRIYKFRISHQHSGAESGHIISLTKRVQVNGNFAGSFNFQDAHWAKMLKID